MASVFPVDKLILKFLVDEENLHFLSAFDKFTWHISKTIFLIEHVIAKIKQDLLYQ